MSSVYGQQRLAAGDRSCDHSDELDQHLVGHDERPVQEPSSQQIGGKRLFPRKPRVIAVHEYVGINESGHGRTIRRASTPYPQTCSM